MKKLLFILLFPVLGYAEGPIMSHKDTTTQQEFENVYKDIRSKVPSSKVIGTTTSDDAAAGYIGEFISSGAVVNTNVPATGVWDDIAAISLTAGDWDVWGCVRFDGSGATWVQTAVAISTNSGNSGTNMEMAKNLLIESWASSSTTPIDKSLCVPNYRVFFDSTKTVYLKRNVNYSAGTPRSRAQFLGARRVR